jgi:hypothetical protein
LLNRRTPGLVGIPPDAVGTLKDDRYEDAHQRDGSEPGRHVRHQRHRDPSGSGQDQNDKRYQSGRAIQRLYSPAQHAPREVLVLASGVEDVEAKLAVAQAYARLDLSAQARAALDEARRLHDIADQSESTIYAMPAWRMALSSSYVYALLGDVQGCNDELAAVTPPPVVRRWEAQREIQRAVAYTRSGDTANGAVTANKVMHETLEEERSIVFSEMYKEATRRTRES